MTVAALGGICLALVKREATGWTVVGFGDSCLGFRVQDLGFRVGGGSLFFFFF